MSFSPLSTHTSSSWSTKSPLLVSPFSARIVAASTVSSSNRSAISSRPSPGWTCTTQAGSYTSSGTVVVVVDVVLDVVVLESVESTVLELVASSSVVVSVAAAGESDSALSPSSAAGEETSVGVSTAPDSTAELHALAVTANNVTSAPTRLASIAETVAAATGDWASPPVDLRGPRHRCGPPGTVAHELRRPIAAVTGPEPEDSRMISGGAAPSVAPRSTSPRRLAWRCPNATPDDPNHVLHLVGAAGGNEPILDEPGAVNPMFRYGPRLAWWAFARANGLTPDACETLTHEVAGDFRITPFRVCERLSAELGSNIWVKDETGGVAGSHKARHLIGILLHLGPPRRSGC